MLCIVGIAALLLLFLGWCYASGVSDVEKELSQYREGDHVITRVMANGGGGLQCRYEHLHIRISSVDIENATVTGVVTRGARHEMGKTMDFKYAQIYSNDTLRVRNGLEPLGDFLESMDY